MPSDVTWAFSSLWLSTSASLCLRLLCALALCPTLPSFVWKGVMVRVCTTVLIAAYVSLPLWCLYHLVKAQAPTAQVCRRAPLSEPTVRSTTDVNRGSCRLVLMASSSARLSRVKTTQPESASSAPVCQTGVPSAACYQVPLTISQ